MRRTKLASAITLALAGSAGAVLNTAQAVHVNPDGLGEVLLYSYYTVREGTDTLVSVVNTTADVKAVKVRFLEGKNSTEVIDFNLYLSPFDVWTAAITQTADGARLLTADTSCTVPQIPIPGGVDFRNFAYTGANADGEDTSLDRTREGYLEMIEMGVVTDEPAPSTFNPATDATHVANTGVPANCGDLVAAWAPGGEWFNLPNRAIIPNFGGLFGGGTLINVELGTSVGYKAITLDSFLNGETAVPPFTTQHTAPGSLLPNLTSASPESVVFTQGGVVSSTWAAGIRSSAEAVSAVFMHDNVYNEFVTEAITAAGTDWVVTFPTKRFHVGIDDPSIDDPPAGSPDNLFFPPFTDDFWLGGACETVLLSGQYGREEEVAVGDVDFSPQPPGGVNQLCWEVNVVTFNNSDVLGSQLLANINTLTENGWQQINFPLLPGLTSDFVGVFDGHTMVDDAGLTYFGLPTLGFSVQNFLRGDASANYSGLFRHSFSRLISGAP